MDICHANSNTTQRLDSISLKTWCLSPRQLCDVECILNGAFAPLEGFLNEHEYQTVCENMRLNNGKLWPIPITLDVSQNFAQQLQIGEQIILSADDHTLIALLTIQSVWKPNKTQEALQVFATNDSLHPAVDYLHKHADTWYVGGALTRIALPAHYDFLEYRHTPAELKKHFSLYGWTKIIAFQTRNPMHRAHYELTKRAAEMTGANLLIHPVTGMTKPGDIDYITRVKCYIQILHKYNSQGVMLSLLPLAMRMGGPREALWHAIIRKNYGVTHFIVGRDHAGPGNNAQGNPFYDSYAAQHLVLEHAQEIDISILPFSTMAYVKEKKQFFLAEEMAANDRSEDISGTDLRKKLINGLPIPEWFTFPEIQNILHAAYPAKAKQGLTIFFTGLSGAGKSTLAQALQARLQEMSTRTITLLDGDILRKELSRELGFSPADRDTHICRVGYVAAEITKHRGIALCAAIAPFEATRQVIRKLIGRQGNFFEIYVATPLAICKQRDVKGLYKKAECGLIPNFTGISAPYEPPSKPELIIDTATTPIAEAIHAILIALQQQGMLCNETL